MEQLKHYPENYEVIDSLFQRQAQFGNLGVELIRVVGDDEEAEKGAIVLVEHESENGPYLLDNAEAQTALADPSAYLRDTAISWAENTDDQFMEEMRWGLSEPSEHVIAEDYDGECKVLIQGDYYSHSPLSWASEEGEYEPIIFANSKDAKTWISGWTSDTYYLSHNEAGRPDYYIMEA